MSNRDEDYIETLNTIYDNEGFHQVLCKVSGDLEYGMVKETEKGLYEITTMGWSEDEHILHSLTYYTCKLRKHYVGYITGGAYYFTVKPRNTDNVRMTLKSKTNEYGVRFRLTHNMRDEWEIIDDEQETLTIYNDLGSVYFSSAPSLCELLNDLNEEKRRLEKEKGVKLD